MSTVYLAEHVLMRRRVAIKVLPQSRVDDASYLRRFHREAQAVAALDHQNIVRAYDVNHDGQVHYLVMEHVSGSNLHALVSERTQLGFVEAVEYIRQAAKGLQYAHQAGLVHRDIKPSNLLVDDRGVLKLLDLGLARFFRNQDEEALTIKFDEVVLGTADYLSPEQALDSHDVDTRTDIYSLGCTMYFLVTGHPPFPEGTLAQRLIMHQMKEPAPVQEERKDIPPELVELINIMMRKKPEDRFQTAQEVANTCQDWLEEHGGEIWKSMKKLSETPAVPVQTPVRDSPSSIRNTKPSSRGSIPKPPSRQSGTSKLAEMSTRIAKPTDDPSPSDIDDFVITINTDPSDTAPVTAHATDVVPQNIAARMSDVLKPVLARDRRKLAIGAGALVLLVAVIGSLLIGSGTEDTSSQPAAPDRSDSTNAGPDTPDEGGVAEDIGPRHNRIIKSIGPDGDFPTIKAALDFARSQTPSDQRNAHIRFNVAAGQTFEERIVIDNLGAPESRLPRGIHIVVEDGFATLAPGGTEPVISIIAGKDRTSEVRFLHLEGFRIQADNRDVAVRLAGVLPRCEFRRLEIQGFEKTGLLCDAPQAFLNDDILLANMTFAAASPTGIGIHFQQDKSHQDIASHVRIEGCRFLGPLNVGIEFSAPVRGVDVSQSIFHNAQTGIRLNYTKNEASVLSINRNTFHQCGDGLHLARLAQIAHGSFAISHNIFADLKGAAVRVENDYSATMFWQKFSSGGGGLEKNWSNRPLSDNGADIFRQGRTEVEFQFQSTDPNSAQFLLPTQNSSHAHLGYGSER